MNPQPTNIVALIFDVWYYSFVVFYLLSFIDFSFCQLSTINCQPLDFARGSSVNCQLFDSPRLRSGQVAQRKLSTPRLRSGLFCQLSTPRLRSGLFCQLSTVNCSHHLSLCRKFQAGTNLESPQIPRRFFFASASACFTTVALGQFFKYGV